MKRLILTLAALALGATTATAGPLARLVRRHHCPPVQGTVPPQPMPAVPTTPVPPPGGLCTASFAAFVPPATCGPAGCPR